MAYLSLTTWSLHRSLGPLRWTQWDPHQKMQVTQLEAQSEVMRLIDLPAVAAAKGFQALDVCHFHIPDTSDSSLRSLRQSFAESNVEFHTLLLDYGDISSSDEIRRQSDVAFIKNWIDIAAIVGAESLRVVAGESDAADKLALERSAQALKTLMDYGREQGVKIITENFRCLTSTIENCLYLNEACEGQLRFIADFGNFKSASKYDDLAKLAEFAENIHGKANYDAAGFPDAPEFDHCLEAVLKATYSGPVTVVYDGPGDEWAGIERVRQLIAPHFF